MKKEKPQKCKPQFYSHCFNALHQIARENGYNLLIHGSMDRDMDLVAVPWVDNPSTHFELLIAFSKYLGCNQFESTDYYMPSKLGGGRMAYVINLYRGEINTSNDFHKRVYAEDQNNDAQFYLDISITPLKTE